MPISTGTSSCVMVIQDRALPLPICTSGPLKVFVFTDDLTLFPAVVFAGTDDSSEEVVSFWQD